MTYSKNKKKVLIALSGGVDSSWAAKLIKKESDQVLGIFLRLGVKEEEKQEEKARNVAKLLNIDFYPFNLSQKFKKDIIDYFLKSYQRGMTPNPCVKCNKIIKFRELMKLADNLGYTHLATGHYVRREQKKGKNYLKRARDKNKDQSYFLYNLTQKQLARCLFPLGGLLKTEVKEKAKKNKLYFYSKESQDICFIQGDHNDFLKKYLPLKKGPIKNLEGKLLGEHEGLPLYTLGQRKGVEIGEIGPLYVVKRDYRNNTLYVTDNPHHHLLFRDNFQMEKINWINKKKGDKIECEVVIRYGAKPVKGEIKKNKQGNWEVKLKEKIRAITPGQSAVFYDKNMILGGGVIKLTK